MSVRRVPKSPFWWWDFSYKGERFRGSTECTEKRAAEARERQERERVKVAAKASKPAPGMSLDAAVGRYWEEVGQHTTASDELFKNLERIQDWIGPTTPISAITNETVSALVARRRGEFRDGKPKLGLVSASTVNRSFTAVLRRILTRARTDWGVALVELSWKTLLLPEPKARVRELKFEEEARLEAVELPGYTELRRFAQITGLRKRSALIVWDQVDWNAGIIKVVQKGGDDHRVPITKALRALLWPIWCERDPNLEEVFLYTASRTTIESRTKKVIEAGVRYPITYSGWQSAHIRACGKAKVTNFRIHDERHTAATRTLRGSRNLAAVQKLLGHSDVSTTMKYAHVLDEDLREAMEAGSADDARRRAEFTDREKRHTSRHTGDAGPAKLLNRNRKVASE